MRIRHHLFWALMLALGHGWLAPSPTAADDQGKLSKLHVHGYLTQAYGEADLGDDPELLAWTGGAIVGLSEDGTTDYRTLALQFRYDLTARSSMVVQLDHERTGEELSLLRTNDVEVDWVFFQHRFKNNVSVRVGRIPLPWGIYNEIRDVGTLLPFYRPPQALYLESGPFEGAFEGLLFSNTFFTGSAWPLELSLFGGESAWESVVFDDQGAVLPVSGRVDRLGFSAWLETPVDGLRIGASFLEEDFRRGSIPEGQSLPADTWLISIDGSFDRFFVRAEYQDLNATRDLTAVEVTSFGRSDTEKATFYVEAGVTLVDGLELLGQYLEGNDETLLVENPAPGSLVTPKPLELSSETDRVIGLRYRFGDGVVLRGEYHNLDEVFLRFSQAQVTPRPDGRINLEIPSDSGKADYFIVSLSASF